MSNLGNLNAVEESYRNRFIRAKELTQQGQKFIGYFCSLVPAEMLTTAGLIPFRITGDVNEPITKADVHLETIMCSFVRNAFDLGLKGRYEFLDGLVVPHACDAIFRIYDIWRSCIPANYTHFINVPHMTAPSSFEFFEAELKLFRHSLEDYTGVEFTDDRLSQAIHLHNEHRQLMRHLYELRKADPPLISGSEMIKVQVAARSLPMGESNKLVQTIIEEAQIRRPGPADHAPRILLYGAEVDQPSFVELIEKSGAHVVVDATCMGAGDYWHDVEVTPNPLAALAHRYLGKLACPRTCRPRSSPGHSKDLDSRFGYLGRLATEFKANAAIVYVIRFCDTHELDAPDVREYLESTGLRVLDIEDEYHTQSRGRLHTRVQAFVEGLSDFVA